MVMACVMISMYFSGTIYMGFTTIFTPIANEMGWSYTQISFAASIRGFEAGLLVPISGMIMDRWGPRRLLIGGTLITGVGLILLSRIQSLPMFYIAFGLICVGMSAAPTGLLMSAMANWFRKNEGLAMGITASGVSFGGLLIPVVTYLVDTFGWRQAMMMVGFGVWAFPLPISLILRHKPEKYGYQPDGVRISVSESIVQPMVEVKKNKDPDFSTKQALCSWVFWTIAVALLFHVMAVNAIATHIMPFFSSIGVKRSVSGFIISAVPLIGIVGRIGFGWLGDRIDKMKIATLALVLTGLGTLIFMFVTADRVWLIIIFIVVYGIGWGGIVPMSSGLVIKYFGRNRVGTIVGCINSVMMLGSMTGAPLAGWTFDMKGSYQMAWLIMGSMIMIATIAFFFLLRQYQGDNLANSKE